MAITIQDIENIAALAKLELSRDEMQKLLHHLGEIIAYVEKLNELDTDKVEPTHHVLNLTNVLRDDQVGPCLTADEATANAPDKIDHYFGVPKVIDQGSNAQ